MFFHHFPNFIKRWFFSINHKDIGTFFSNIGIIVSLIVTFVGISVTFVSLTTILFRDKILCNTDSNNSVGKLIPAEEKEAQVSSLFEFMLNINSFLTYFLVYFVLFSGFFFYIAIYRDKYFFTNKYSKELVTLNRIYLLSFLLVCSIILYVFLTFLVIPTYSSYMLQHFPTSKIIYNYCCSKQVGGQVFIIDMHTLEHTIRTFNTPHCCEQLHQQCQMHKVPRTLFDYTVYNDPQYAKFKAQRANLLPMQNTLELLKNMKQFQAQWDSFNEYLRTEGLKTSLGKLTKAEHEIFDDFVKEINNLPNNQAKVNRYLEEMARYEHGEPHPKYKVVLPLDYTPKK
jgi:hypothetical protein